MDHEAAQAPQTLEDWNEYMGITASEEGEGE